MEEKPECKPKVPDEKTEPGKAPGNVAPVEVPLAESIQIDYRDDLPPAPPGLEIHPRRPLPPVPEAKPDPKKHDQEPTE